MALEKFVRLEEGLDRLLGGFEALKRENEELKDALGSKDRELLELKEKITKLDKEKGLVKEKVDGLLERLEGLIQNA